MTQVYDAVADWLRRYMARAPRAVAVVTGPAHHVLAANLAFCQLTRTGDARVGCPVTDGCAPGRTPALRALLDRARRTRAPAHGLVPATHDDYADAWQCTVWPATDRPATEGDTDDADDAGPLVVEVSPASDTERAGARQRDVTERVVLGALHEQRVADEAQRAQATAERRVVQLQQLTERVSAALATADVMRVAAHDVAVAFDAVAAVVFSVPPAGGRLEAAAEWESARPADGVLADGAVASPADGSVGQRHAAAAAAAIDAEELIVRTTAEASVAAVPLRDVSGTLGALTLELRPPRPLTTDDRNLLRAAGRIAAQGVTRARLQSLREEERRRLARELHDEFGQALTGLKLDLAWLGRQLGTRAPDLMADTVGMAARVDATVDAVRRIAAELRPAVLDDLGLVAALEWQCAEFVRRSGIPCTLDVWVDDEAIGEPTATAVFRVFQEALTNVARHAHARRVVAQLSRDHRRLTLRVTDDGVGIARAGAVRSGALGVAGMRERAAALGGTVTVCRGRTGGTVVTLVVPDARASESAGSVGTGATGATVGQGAE